MESTPDAVLKELRNNKLHPVYFLQGEESFYIDRISDHIEKNVLQEAEKSFNLTVMYGRDVDASTIVSAARRFPMMAQHQVVVVKEAQGIKDLNREEGANRISEYLKNPAPTTILVFAYKAKGLDKRKALYKEMKKHAVVVDSPKVRDYKLGEWVTNYFRENKLKAHPKAVAMLVDNIGTDLTRLVNEIDKVLINVTEGGEVTPDHIQEFVGISKDFNVFELQNAIARKDALTCYRILDHFSANPKTNPGIMVVAILFGYFSKVLLIHAHSGADDRSLAGKLGINPFLIKDYKVAAKNYPLPKTVHCIHYIRTADLQLKGIGAANADQFGILKEMVFKMIH